MALLKTSPTAAKPSPIMKPAVSSLAGKSPPSTKKSVNIISPAKKPSPLSSIKSKPSAPSKSPVKMEKSPIEAVKSAVKVEKSAPKVTVTKCSIGSTTKTSPSTIKTPMTKSPAAETRTPVRNVIKPITTPKTPEPKQPGFKMEMPIRSSPEKLAGNKTNVTSSSTLKKSPILSVKSAPSPVKSASSPVKSLPSPVKSVPSAVKPLQSPSKSVSSPIKSVASPVKSVSSPVKSISSPVKSVSSPVKLVSSSVKSVSSPIKSVSSPVKSVSSLTKSISSPTKSISSPIKSKLTHEIKPNSTNVAKDIKTKVSTSSSIKKPVSPKSPIKTIPSSGASDNAAKSKPSIRSSLTSKAVKINVISTEAVVKEQPIAESCIVETNNTSACTEKSDLCHCTDTTEKCDQFSNTPIITEYSIDNENFDVVQAFKVAEQLIKIQSNDRNLQTFENNTTVNWDDVITPCDDFIATKSSVENAFVPLEQNDRNVSSRTPEELILKHDSCIVEMANSNISRDSEISTINPHDELITSMQPDENQKIIQVIEQVESYSSESSESQSNDEEKYFSDEFSSESTSCESVETESNDNFAIELASEGANNLIRNDRDENVLPEWTITIDEFSLDLSSKENQYPSIYRIVNEKNNRSVDKTPCTVNMSYADVLKKIPNVLVNTTNVQCRKKEPKLNVNLQIKQYQMSTTVFFNNIENSYQDCDDNYYYEEPQYCEMRKKKCKKIKHLSKRHLRNINREPEYIENHADVFVTSVWKNIY